MYAGQQGGQTAAQPQTPGAPGTSGSSWEGQTPPQPPQQQQPAAHESSAPSTSYPPSAGQQSYQSSNYPASTSPASPSSSTSYPPTTSYPASSSAYHPPSSSYPPTSYPPSSSPAYPPTSYPHYPPSSAYPPSYPAQPAFPPSQPYPATSAPPSANAAYPPSYPPTSYPPSAQPPYPSSYPPSYPPEAHPPSYPPNYPPQSYPPSSYPPSYAPSPYPPPSYPPSSYPPSYPPRSSPTYDRSSGAAGSSGPYPSDSDDTAEIVARTIYVGNIDNRMNETKVRNFFANQFGPVNRIKMGGGQNDFPKFSFIEFASPVSAQNAARATGMRFGARDLKIAMSDNPILTAKDYEKNGKKKKHVKRPTGKFREDGPPPPGAFDYGGAPNAYPPNPYPGPPPFPPGPGAPPPFPAAPGQFGPPPPFGSPPRSFEDESLKDLISRTVYVSGIDQKLDESDVRHFFGMAGRVTACRIRGNPGQDAKFAFVEFSDRVSAQNALECSGQVLGKKTLRVSRSNSAIQTASTRTPFSKISMEDRIRILRTIYVGHLDLSLTEEQISQFFADSGPISKVALAGDESHPTRFAFVEFEDIESAKNALSKDGASFCGHILEVRSSKTPIYQKGHKRGRWQNVEMSDLEGHPDKRRRMDELEVVPPE